MNLSRIITRIGPAHRASCQALKGFAVAFPRVLVSAPQADAVIPTTVGLIALRRDDYITGEADQNELLELGWSAILAAGSRQP